MTHITMQAMKIAQMSVLSELATVYMHHQIMMQFRGKLLRMLEHNINNQLCKLLMAQATEPHFVETYSLLIWPLAQG